jgi:hypothetical protein
MLGKDRPGFALLTLATLVSALAFARQTDAAEQSLRSGRVRGETSRVEVLLEVGGDLSMIDDKNKQSHKLKMSVVGSMLYDEKLLDNESPVTDESTPEGVEPPLGLQGVRQYRRCDAVIKIDKGGAKPRLRDDRRLVAVSATDRNVTLFSPVGPLTREELDLIEIPACSLLVERLLPERAVSQGDEWEHSHDLMAGLLNLDAVSESDVTSSLKELNDTAAQIELVGTVKGAINGVSSVIDVKGRYKFDMASKRITWVALLVKEKRAIGHVAPGVDVVARLQMKITPNSESDSLTEKALADLPLQPQPDLLLLEYESERGLYRFLHERDWHVLNESAESVSLRLIDRGELIAQCNVSSLPVLEPGMRMTMLRFQEDVERALGKNFDRWLSAGEATTSNGHDICRALATGTVEQVPIQWNYFLVADAQGRQAVMAFTMESDLVGRFGKSDDRLLSTLEFLAPADDAKPAEKAPVKAAEETVAKPTKTASPK